MSNKIINNIENEVSGVLTTIGKAGLHALAPDNFEYYLCSFELLDSSGNTNGFLNFTVMPNNIMETKNPISSIIKTNTGITTLFNSTFSPIDISIQGTFGKKLKILFGNKDVKKPEGIPILNGNIFGDIQMKTGYGIIKSLKFIMDESNKLDENGKPNILIFNNYALNTSYIVEVKQYSFSQSVENNTIWYYSVEMKAVAPSSSIKIQDGKKSFFGSIASLLISKGLNKILSEISKKIGL